MPEQSNDYRVVVFGAGGVGKSSLVLRFVKGTFRDTYIPTVEDTYRQVGLSGVTSTLVITHFYEYWLEAVLSAGDQLWQERLYAADYWHNRKSPVSRHAATFYL